MPTCPGCHQQVSYERLDRHERHCHGLGGSDGVERDVERLEDRLDEVETRLDGRIQRIERQVVGRLGADAASDDQDGRLLQRDG